MEAGLDLAGVAAGKPRAGSSLCREKKKQRKATMFDAGVAVSLCRRGPYP
jgi:hypothetical protein